MSIRCLTNSLDWFVSASQRFCTYCRWHEHHHAKLGGKTKIPSGLERMGLLYLLETEW